MDEYIVFLLFMSIIALAGCAWNAHSITECSKVDLKIVEIMEKGFKYYDEEIEKLKKEKAK